MCIYTLVRGTDYEISVRSHGSCRTFPMIDAPIPLFHLLSTASKGVCTFYVLRKIPKKYPKILFCGAEHEYHKIKKNG